MGSFHSLNVCIKIYKLSWDPPCYSAEKTGCRNACSWCCQMICIYLFLKGRSDKSIQKILKRKLIPSFWCGNLSVKTITSLSPPQKKFAVIVYNTVIKRGLHKKPAWKKFHSKLIFHRLFCDAEEISCETFWQNIDLHSSLGMSSRSIVCYNLWEMEELECCVFRKEFNGHVSHGEILG